MPNGIFTPELILEVAEAGEDAVVTAKELSGIMGVISILFAEIAISGFVGILIGTIAKGFTEETGSKTKKIAGIPVRMYGD